MAGDDEATDRSSNAPASAPPGERARTVADAAVGAMKGKLTRWQDAASSDHEASPHTPGTAEGGSGDEKGRSKHPSELPGDVGPVTFGQRLKELRQSLPDIGTLERTIEKGMEPDCP